MTRALRDGWDCEGLGGMGRGETWIPVSMGMTVMELRNYEEE